MKNNLQLVTGILLLAFLWGCGSDDVSQYTEEKYSAADKLKFEKRRDSVFFYEYQKEMKNVASMYCKTLEHADILKAFDEVKAELDTKTGTYYSIDIPFTRNIINEDLKQLLKQEQPYFVIFTRKEMYNIANSDKMANEAHAIMDEYNTKYVAAEAITKTVINNPVLPVFNCENHTNYQFTTKVKNALKEVNGTQYIFVLTQLFNSTPSTTNAGEYYGMVSIVDTYENKIIGDFPIGFLYQKSSDLEVDLHKNMKKYLKKAIQ